WVREGIAVLPIVNLPPPIAIGIVTRRDSPLTPAASLLLDCLQDAVTSLKLNVPARRSIQGR
ncbi:MAG: LysR family transcriptional regulator, regulator of abg operon, partial [Caballeronia sp.]|nr:LysR family transcriptional regulator, regulator of abg operon [Caballeronia sp.]